MNNFVLVQEEQLFKVLFLPLMYIVKTIFDFLGNFHKLTNLLETVWEGSMMNMKYQVRSIFFGLNVLNRLEYQLITLY